MYKWGAKGWVPPVIVIFLSLMIRTILLFAYWPDAMTNINAFKMDDTHFHDYWWILYA